MRDENVCTVNCELSCSWVGGPDGQLLIAPTSIRDEIGVLQMALYPCNVRLLHFPGIKHVFVRSEFVPVSLGQSWRIVVHQQPVDLQPIWQLCVVLLAARQFPACWHKHLGNLLLERFGKIASAGEHDIVRVSTETYLMIGSELSQLQINASHGEI